MASLDKIHTTYNMHLIYTYPLIYYLNTSSYSFYDFYLPNNLVDVAA